MRLLRLHDDAPGGARLELHPRLSVVAGLADDARARLVAALAALPRAAGGAALDGVSGEVEVNGILLDLAPGALGLLDLDADVDLVVRAGDLLGRSDSAADRGTTGGTSGLDAAAAQQAVRDATATHDVLAASLEELHDAHRRVLARRSALALALAEAGAAPDPSDHAADVPVPSTSDDATATHTVMRAATVVLDSPGPSPEVVSALAAAAARVDRLRTRRDEVLAELEPLDGIEVEAVTAALTVAASRPRPREISDPEANRLADELTAAIEALDAHDAEVEATGRGPLAAYRRLDEAQRRFLAADAAIRPPVIDPADAAALEAAHDELLEAELRLTAARLPSKSLKKRLEDAVAVEQEVLGRMGFATYTAYVMSTSVPVVSPELRDLHERAERDYEQAEVAFREAVAAAEADPTRSVLAAAVDVAREAARAMAGDLDEQDLVAALRSRTIVEETATADATASVDALRVALAEAGVDFGELDLADDEVLEVARLWLADMDQALARRGDLARALAVLEEEVTGAERELAQLETAAPSVADLTPGATAPPPPPAPLPPPPPPPPPAAPAPGPIPVGAATVGDPVDLGEAVLDDLHEGLAEIDREVLALDEQIDAQSALLDAAARALASAQAHASDVVGGPAGAADPASFTVTTTIASVDGQGAEVGSVDQIEWYLLSRLAALRSVSYAGALPLVLDDPFGRVADDDVEYLLERLVRMSDAVQVVFVGDDERVRRWADVAGDEVAAVLLA